VAFPCRKYIYGKLHEFDAIRAPDGPSSKAAARRLQKKTIAWKYALQNTIIEKSPFDWDTITGPNPSKAALVKAQKVGLLILFIWATWF